MGCWYFCMQSSLSYFVVNYNVPENSETPKNVAVTMANQNQIK